MADNFPYPNCAPNLEPCPWCGRVNTDGATTEVLEQGRMWTGTRMSAPASYVIRHHCPTVPGQPHRAIERAGRDLESAINAWNDRA